MKLHFVLLAFCGVALAAVVTAVSIRKPASGANSTAATEQRFEVLGQVRGLEADGVTVQIAHEEIPGFMPAMEMPFTVKDPRLLRGLAAGDRVRFKLVVTKDDSWISQIEKQTSEAGSFPPGASANADLERLEIGQQVPDFSLIDQHGRPLRLRDLRGKAVVLTFIYTRCPLPNFCPLMSKNFTELQQRFKKQFPNRVQLLSISFDPQFDTPETLSRYAALYQQDDTGWTFATGSSEQVDQVTRMFGLIREPSNGFINHDLRTVLISPQGKLVHIWRSNVWTSFEVQRMVQETLEPALAVVH